MRRRQSSSEVPLRVSRRSCTAQALTARCLLRSRYAMKRLYYLAQPFVTTTTDRIGAHASDTDSGG